MIGRLKHKIKQKQERKRNEKLAQIVDWKSIPVVLFVSTGRTGTQFFADFFTQQSDQLLALHEPAPDLFLIGTDYYRGRKNRLETMAEMAIERARYAEQVTKNGLRFYVESNWNLVPLLELLPEFFGEFKLVHVVRDPKTYIPSAHGIKGSKRPIYAEYDNRDRLTAQDKLDDQYFNDWNTWGRFEKLCWHWRTYNLMIEEFGASHDQYLRIKFEDIFNSETNYSGIDTILEFTGLGDVLDNGVEAAKDQLKNKSNRTKTPILGHYDSWSKDQQSIFHTLTDELARRYMYDK